jgi:hypothetical protein
VVGNADGIGVKDAGATFVVGHRRQLYPYGHPHLKTTEL